MYIFWRKPFERVKRLHLYLWLMSVIPILILFTGCTHDHKINLQPEIFVPFNNIGNEERLTIQVKDIRPRNAISKKESGLNLGSGLPINTVNIYASSNVRDTIRDKIFEGFQRIGFRTVKSGRPTKRKLEVEIVRLQLDYKRGDVGMSIPKIHAQMETILRVQATNEDKTFKNIYKSRMKKSHPMGSGKFKNERLVNNSLSMAIQSIFEDRILIQFLVAGRP